MRMKRGIAFAGNILVDNVKTISSWPERGMLVPIVDMHQAVGGSVCNTAVDLNTLDASMPVSALGKVGADAAGDFAVRILSSHGIDCGRIMRAEGVPTSFTDVMTVAGSGERTFFNMRGADSKLTPEDVDCTSLDCAYFHLGYLLLLDGLDAPDEEFGTKAARLLAQAQKAGLKTSLDLVSEQSDRFAGIVRPALRFCDNLIVNEIEGSRATGLPCRSETDKTSVKHLTLIAEKLLAFGVRERVVLHCPELSVCLSADGRLTAVPSLELPPGWIKGAVGAGDAFCAGMLYAIMSELDDEQGLRLASCAAAANLSVADSVSGALPLEETWALDRRFSRKDISAYA